MIATSRTRSLVVFSGGSAANSLVDVFNRLIELEDGSLSYIIPISDNGGSSSELIRVFGGPGIGDVRSRLIRLIPNSDSHDDESRTIRAFFNHRLPYDQQAARMLWLDIVDARHELWNGIDSGKKEMIRSFLNHLNLEMVKRSRPSSTFNFEGASIGNMFLTGARLFTGSFESAIYMLSNICSIPHNVSVLPSINTNFSHHICAGLANGDTIYGQNSISHPSASTAVPSSPPATVMLDDSMAIKHYEAIEHADTIEDANLPGSLPTLRRPAIRFSKTHTTSDDLPAPINRVWYINPYGQEIRPPPNPKIVRAAADAQSIIYSIGSLYTSIVPNLILRGVGAAIASGRAKQKILILNGSLDRETPAYTAVDFVQAIAQACLESSGSLGRKPRRCELSAYVTHVIYIEGDGAPFVDREELSIAGIETLRMYGRRMSGENSSGWMYDETALTQALEALIGRRSTMNDKTRRNTLEH